MVGSGSLSAPLTVTFLGAAQTVTGSMHLVESGGTKLLLDCGLYRGPRAEARLRNATFPFDPADIDAVILSHAHIDHCGNLPTLVRQGFNGPIYCTAATRDLIGLMLHDSARIQEEESLVHMAAGRGGDSIVRPLYVRADVVHTQQLCVALPYDEPRTITPGVEVRLLDAGHLLGSAMIHLRIDRGGRSSRLTFTGDLGRSGLHLLPDPGPVPLADLIICESTYGGRVHEAGAQLARELADVVRRTVARGGKVLIPAFSLGRTQLVAYFLWRGMRQGEMPQVPVYVDSPLAADVASVYQQYTEHFDAPARRLLADAGSDFLDGSTIHYTRSVEESKQVSLRPDPCVMIASGGMCEGGRILTHLRQHVDDPRCSLVLVSYQAPHTLGRKLLDPGPTVRFHGREWNKWIEVVELPGFLGPC